MPKPQAEPPALTLPGSATWWKSALAWVAKALLTATLTIIGFTGKWWWNDRAQTIARIDATDARVTAVDGRVAAVATTMDTRTLKRDEEIKGINNTIGDVRDMVKETRDDVRQIHGALMGGRQARMQGAGQEFVTLPLTYGPPWIGGQQ